MISKKLLVMLVALMLGSAALWAQQTVTVVPGVNGTVEVDNDTPAAGDIVTITVTPAPGYQVTKEDVVAEVTIDPGSANAPLRPKDISVGEFLELTGDTPSDPTQAATYTFEMPASPLNVRVSATFTEAPVFYTVTIDENVEHGTIAILNEGDSFQAGETIRFIAVPDADYHLVRLYVQFDESSEILYPDFSNGAYYFDMPEENVTIYATFSLPTFDVMPEYYIENGEITLDRYEASVGQTVTITVTPDEGYELDELYVVYGYENLDPEPDNPDGAPRLRWIPDAFDVMGTIEPTKVDESTYTFVIPEELTEEFPWEFYVLATFKEAAAPVPPLYVIGDFGHGWTPNDGVEFNYDAENEQYTLDVMASGTAYFSIATALAESGDDWAFINSHRLGGSGNAHQNFIITAKNHNNIELIAFDENTDGAGQTFQITSGAYTIVVSSDFSTMQVLGDFPAEKYFLIGSYNSWSQDTKREMTLENGKYVITQAMDANAEFKLVNEANDVWYGAQSEGNFVVTEEQVTQGTGITILMGGGNNLQIPVAGEWTFTFDDETMKLVISGEWVTPTTLAEILAADPVDENVVVANDLAVVDILADQHIAFATDGDGNWVELSMDNDVLDFIEATPTLAGGSIKGLFIHDSFNPTIVIEEMPEAAQEAMQIEPAVYPVNLDFAPKPCEVFYVTGYYHSTGGTNNGANLREWSGNGGQMGVLLDLDLSWARGDMTDGEHYKIRGTALLKEAWDDPAPDGIRPMVSHDDPMALRNYTIMATEIPNTPTAIDHLTQNVGVKSVRYYNLQGVELSAPAEGLNIMVIEHADGTTTTQKILK